MYKYLLDTDIKLYDILGLASFGLLVLFNFANIRTKKHFLSYASQYTRFSIENSRFKNKLLSSYIPWAFIEILLLCVVQNAFGATLNKAFGHMVGTGANYFGLLFATPIMLVAFCMLIGINPLKQIDIITPAFPLALFVGKIACFCAGCCTGFAWKQGLYNYTTHRSEFPTQLLEAGLVLLIFIFMMIFRKKIKTGTMFPIYMIVYCGTRFFSEFTRSEENVWGILKTYHILCIIGFIVGIIELIVVLRFNDKLTRIFSKSDEEIKKSVEEKKRKKLSIKNKYNKNGHKKSPETINQPEQKAIASRTLILLWLLGLIGQIGWNIENVWFNTFVYSKIEKNPSIITCMLILSALATTISVFVFGTLSDRTGKRRTFMSIGYIAWGVLTIAFAATQFMAKNFFTFAVVCIIFGDMLVSLFASMGTDVGFAAWTTDIIKNSNRGQIGGIIAVQCVLGTMLGNIIGGFLVGQNNNYLRLFVVIGLILIFTGIFAAIAFTKKDDVPPAVRGAFTSQFFSVFDIRSLLKNKELFCVNIAVAIFFTGFNTYFVHLGNYIIHYLGFSADKMGIIEAVPLVLAMIVTLPVSKHINNDKFREISIASVVIGIIGMLFMYPLSPIKVNPYKIFNFDLYLAVFLLGVSYVIMLQATKVWTKKLYPVDSKAQYEGSWIVSYALIPMTLASIISQAIVRTSGLSVINDLTGKTEYIPNGNLFLAGTLISALSIIPVIISKKYHTDAKKKSSKKSR